MKIEIKVPNWVNTDDEGICMLFAFLRRITIEYQLTGKPLDVYGTDIRRICNFEINNVHDYLMEFVDTKYCKIAKLSREHFVFYMTGARTGTRVFELKEHSSHVRWAYLMGCTNYNLLEEDSISLSRERRPHYTPMYKMDKELFTFTSRGRE
jgi:hypothetical protein